MCSQSHQLPLHIALFPFMSHSHMMATIDLAKLLASRGPKVTLLTTPSNSPIFYISIHKSQEQGHRISLHIIKFPSSELGLPEGFETLNFLKSPPLKERFLKVVPLLEKPLDEFLQKHRPNVLVADIYFSWANNLAAKHGIPRLMFHGTCNFAICASLCIDSFKPHKNVSSESETFVIPNLPGNIEFSRNQLPTFMKLEDDETEMVKVFRASADSDSKCYGVIVNSFYELEPAYSDFYRNFLGRKTWNIGPISLCNNDSDAKANRGNRASASSINLQCVNWLDHKESNSVIYICFGSTTMFTNEQLKEIALGLEASGVEFIWVINKNKEDDDDDRKGKEEWLPEGFENRTKEKGLILRNWAPQLVIISHRAVGAFVTHCGWNSVMEAVAAGVAMVTWPVGAEQFFNEKLVTEVLKIGVGVGVQKWVRWVGDSVKYEAIERAIKKVMAGDEAIEMRIRARGFAEKARETVAGGGSSHADLTSLIEELLCPVSQFLET